MTWASTPVRVGTRFTYEGSVHEIIDLHVFGGCLEVLAKTVRGNILRRLSIYELLMSDRVRFLPADDGAAAQEETDVAAVVLSAVPAAVRQAGVRTSSARARSSDRIQIRMRGNRFAG